MLTLRIENLRLETENYHRYANRWVIHRHVTTLRKIVAKTLVAKFGRTPPDPPLLIRIVRIGPGNPDLDNITSGDTKDVRDEIAKWLEIDDGDPSLVWTYEKRSEGPGKYAVEITIGPVIS